MLKSFTCKVEPLEKNIQVVYNNGNCYKCRKSDKLKPLPLVGNNTKDTFSQCTRCNINLLLLENMTEDRYQKIVTEKISEEFEKTIKKESFNNFISKMNASI